MRSCRSLSDAARATAGVGGRWQVLTLCWDHHRALLKLPLLGLLSP